jgi:hypothetical protein
MQFYCTYSKGNNSGQQNILLEQDVITNLRFGALVSPLAGLKSNIIPLSQGPQSYMPTFSVFKFDDGKSKSTRRHRE